MENIILIIGMDIYTMKQIQHYILVLLVMTIVLYGLLEGIENGAVLDILMVQVIPILLVIYLMLL